MSSIYKYQVPERSEVEALVSAYINQYRSTNAIVLSGLTSVARYRSNQLVTNFAHTDGIDACNALQYIATEVICGKTPPTADAGNYGGSVPFITIPDMHGSVYTTSTERFLSDKGVATQANKTLPENSICVSCIASVGLVCLTAEPSQTNQQINSIICKKNISPFYVYIKMTTLTEYLKQLGAGGSTTLNVNKTLFGQIPILLPEESVMKEFHGKVEPLFSAIRANQYEMQHLESLKSLLLTQISSR